MTHNSKNKTKYIQYYKEKYPNILGQIDNILCMVILIQPNEYQIYHNIYNNDENEFNKVNKEIMKGI